MSDLERLRMTDTDKPLNLYLVSQHVNDDYDTWDSFVVATTTPYKAKHTWPFEGSDDHTYYSRQSLSEKLEAWAKPEYCRVELIGTAKPGTKEGVICASFNAG